MTAQLERLNRDVIELDTYINKLKKRGRIDIIPKMMKKKLFLQPQNITLIILIVTQKKI